MTATLALVGRPNVGKSTLFNRLTRGRDALVADVPGLTRDRRYGRADIGPAICTLIDTGGLLGEDGELTVAMGQQAAAAMQESDALLFLVDARDGLTPIDQQIAADLRRTQRPVILVVNKVDGVNEDQALAEFSTLGFDTPVFLSAAHGRGVGALYERIVEVLGPFAAAVAPDPAAADDDTVRVALIGRPNVGKSTLTNRLLGEERQVVFDQPGTTRDAIEIPFERDGRSYVLIDTAGVRRKGRVDEMVEKFSVVKTLDAMERAAVVVLVLDAQEGIVDQDLHLLSYAADAGAGIILALNKWDGLTADARRHNETAIERRLRFAPWIPVLKISALHGTGVGHLLELVDRVYRAGKLDVPTSLLTRLLERLIAAHPPPSVNGRQIKLRFAHRAGSHPPRIAIHGNQTDSVPAAYVRYLENGFRDALELIGSPVKLDFRTSDNPYAGRRNVLTPRQQKRRQDMVRHHKKKGRRG